LLDRGVEVDHTTIFRWIQAYSPELERRMRPHLRPCTISWRVEETYVKVKGRWMYLYRAVDSRGDTIDFLLSARRDAAAAKRFFRKALGQPHTVNPRTITVDKNPAYPKGLAEMKSDGELGRFAQLRQCKYLNNIVEQDHRRIKRLTRPGLGFGGFWTARRTLAGCEAMAMMSSVSTASIFWRSASPVAVAAFPEVVEAYLVTGESTISSRSPSPDEALRQRLYKIDGIRHSRSVCTLRCIKRESSVSIGCLSPAP
jgi:transposase, IS6 family